jgi:ankyrin repeat protein
MSPEQQYFAAAARGDRETLERLLDENPDLRNARDENGLSAVMQACYNRRPETALWLIAQGTPLDLYEASAAGQAARVAEWLDGRPGDIDAYSPDGWTALHLAAFFGHPPVIEALIDRGASLQLPSRSAFARGNTALHAAVAGGSPEAAASLIARGADVNARQEPGGFTPLHIAAFHADPRLALALLAAGADPSLRDDEGRSPADIAREKRNDEVANALRK